MKDEFIVLSLIVSLFVFMLSLWCIDVSVTTMNLGIMANGFFNLDPVFTYHLGLYSSMLSFLFIIGIFIKNIFG